MVLYGKGLGELGEIQVAPYPKGIDAIGGAADEGIVFFEQGVQGRQAGSVKDAFGFAVVQPYGEMDTDGGKLALYSIATTRGLANLSAACKTQ